MPDEYYNSAFTGEEIDAILGGAVRGDVAQTKADTWKATARANVGAVSAADLKNFFALTASNATTIPDNTDIDNYKTAGTYKVTNNTHAGTMTNLPVKVAGKLVVIALGQEARLGQLYFVSSGVMPMYVRYWNGSTWSAWERIIRQPTTDALAARISPLEVAVAPLAKKVNILYESGRYASGAATERISVYIPATVGYILYRLYHFIVPSINCNCWQVYYYYAADDSFSNLVQLSVSGELECAIHLDGRDDFSGGRTHGDEVLTGISFFVNGVPSDITTYTSMTEVDSFRIVRTSTMYDPADHTTAIANHGVEYLFDKNGMTISQSLKWLVAAQLTNCFMAMFLPSKNMIDRAVVNTDFETLTLASTSSEPLTTITKQNGTKVFMWDTENSYSASVEVLKYPTGLTGGDRMSIGDNGGGTYNKVYFKVCGGGSSAVGELWQSKALYKLNNG